MARTDRHRAPSRLLVLDVGGVLITDPMPILFGRLAQAGECPRETIRRFYLANLRDRFWSGQMPEDEFWSRLLCSAGLSAADAREWRSDLLSWQAPLPAVARLEGWRQRARLAILSNHRSAWVRPALAAAGVTVPDALRVPAAAVTPEASPVLVERALISEETGLVKPDAAAFRAAAALAEAGMRCLLVDDQAQNVSGAAAAGLPALLADPEGCWMADVDAWLES